MYKKKKSVLSVNAFFTRKLVTIKKKNDERFLLNFRVSNISGWRFEEYFTISVIIGEYSRNNVRFDFFFL